MTANEVISSVTESDVGSLSVSASSETPVITDGWSRGWGAWHGDRSQQCGDGRAETGGEEEQ